MTMFWNYSVGLDVIRTSCSEQRDLSSIQAYTPSSKHLVLFSSVGNHRALNSVSSPDCFELYATHWHGKSGQTL